MPLNLNEYVAKDETIIFNDIEFKITSNIPIKQMDKFMMLENIDEKTAKETYALSMQWIKEILYLKNEKDIVDNFVDNLTLYQMNKIIMFISEYIKESTSEKKKIE